MFSMNFHGDGGEEFFGRKVFPIRRKSGGFFLIESRLDYGDKRMGVSW